MDALTATAWAMDATPDARAAAEIVKAADRAVVAVVAIDDACLTERLWNARTLRPPWTSRIAANRLR